MSLKVCSGGVLVNVSSTQHSVNSTLEVIVGSRNSGMGLDQSSGWLKGENPPARCNSISPPFVRRMQGDGARVLSANTTVELLLGHPRFLK